VSPARSGPKFQGAMFWIMGLARAADARVGSEIFRNVFNLAPAPARLSCWRAMLSDSNRRPVTIGVGHGLVKIRDKKADSHVGCSPRMMCAMRPIRNECWLCFGPSSLEIRQVDAYSRGCWSRAKAATVRLWLSMRSLRLLESVLAENCLSFRSGDKGDELLPQILGF